jgi:signal transduction histidine kinase
VIDEIPLPSLATGHRVPRVVYILRAIGFAGMAVILFAAFSSDPEPGLHGQGAGVLAAVVLLVTGLGCTLWRRALPRGVRFLGLVAVALAGALLAYFQPGGAGIGAVYYVFAMGELRMPRRASTFLASFALAAQAVGIIAAGDQVDDRLVGLIAGTVPWFFVLRLLRDLRMRGQRAEELVIELRESRAAEAQAAALGERARVARDMHDVLAHSLSALALQLEAARLMARDRDADPEVVAAIETAHRLAAGGLDEARRSIAALRGDELPGPDGLAALVEAFGERASLAVHGEPRELSSEARLAVYRTAQEALTNVRRHAAADRVEVSLDYRDGATVLTVADHGPGAPVMLGAPAGGGYGLTGMRERAELLGGRLRAQPTTDGFEVELWLPA